jgi:amino acid transporter
MEKSEYSENTVAKKLSGEDPEIQQGGLNDPNHVELTRALKARHITMIGTWCRGEIWTR